MQKPSVYAKPFKAVGFTTPRTFSVRKCVYRFSDTVSIPQISSNGAITLPSKEEDLSHFVVLKIEGCGVCSTDLHMFGGKRFLYEKADSKNLVIPGHEFFGRVVWAHGRYARLTGRNVVADPIIDCFKGPQCPACRSGKNYMHMPFQEMGICGKVPGGFAEYAVCLAKNCYPVKESMTVKQKALVEPLATVLYALRDVLKLDRAPRSYGVIGSGNIGLLALQCLKSLNPKNVVVMIDKNKAKLDLAKRLKADAVISADLARVDFIRKALVKTGKPGGLDVVLEMSGSDQAINLIPHITRKCGQVLFYGLGHRRVQIDQFDLFIEKEISIASSLGVSNQRRFQEAVDLIPSFESERIISHTYHFDTIGKLLQKKSLPKTYIKGVLLP